MVNNEGRHHMHASKVALCAAVAAACVGIGAGTALAGGIQRGNSDVGVGTFTDTEPLSGVVVTDFPCVGGQTGVASGTDTISGHFNNAPYFFHFAGTETIDARVDFPDGSYAIGELVNRFADSANAEAGQREADTVVGRTTATLYSAAGTQTGTVTMHETSHITYADLNQNGQVDPGEVKSDVDHISATCG
jgi:hypothetical protein